MTNHEKARRSRLRDTFAAMDNDQRQRVKEVMERDARKLDKPEHIRLLGIELAEFAVQEVLSGAAA